MIFLGGTGRSGTTVLAQMFQQDPRFAVFIEPRFLIDQGGILDYAVNQTISREEFVRNMVKRFLPRMNVNLERFGILPQADDVFTEQVVFDVDADASAAAHQRYEYARLFTLSLLGRIHTYLGTQLLVYKTPHVVAWSAYLHLIFPTGKFVHIIRDPRDVCASVVRRNWGPPSVGEFPSWYNRLMRQAWEGKAYLPPDKYTVVSLDRMVNQPAKTFTLLCEKLRVRLPSEITLQKVTRLVNEDDCHRARFAEDLSEKDADFVHARCWRFYKQWLDLSIV